MREGSVVSRLQLAERAWWSACSIWLFAGCHFTAAVHVCGRGAEHTRLRSHTPAPHSPRHSPQLFIFILCQSSLRLIIQKALNLGMGREFQVRSSGRESGRG